MGIEVLKLSAVALIAICAVAVIKSYRPELAMQVSIGAGIVILAYGMNAVAGIAQTADSFFIRYGIDSAAKIHVQCDYEEAEPIIDFPKLRICSK